MNGKDYPFPLWCLLWVLAFAVAFAADGRAQNQAKLDLREDLKVSALSVSSITRMATDAMQAMGCTVREQDPGRGLVYGTMGVPNDAYGRQVSIRVRVERDTTGKVVLPIETVDCPDCSTEGYSSQALEVSFIQYFLQAMNQSPEYLNAGRAPAAPPPVSAVQPVPKPTAPPIQIGKVEVQPVSVKAGSRFNVVAEFIVTDASAAAQDIPVQFRLSILEQSNVLFNSEVIHIPSTNGGTMRRTEPLTASRKKGAYELKVSLQYRDKVEEKSVRFVIE